MGCQIPEMFGNRHDHALNTLVFAFRWSEKVHGLQDSRAIGDAVLAPDYQASPINVHLVFRSYHVRRFYRIFPYILCSIGTEARFALRGVARPQIVHMPASWTFCAGRSEAAQVAPSPLPSEAGGFVTHSRPSMRSDQYGVKLQMSSLDRSANSSAFCSTVRRDWELMTSKSAVDTCAAPLRSRYSARIWPMSRCSAIRAARSAGAKWFASLPHPPRPLSVLTRAPACSTGGREHKSLPLVSLACSSQGEDWSLAA
jgi:hypothetical protein